MNGRGEWAGHTEKSDLEGTGVNRGSRKSFICSLKCRRLQCWLMDEVTSRRGRDG